MFEPSMFEPSMSDPSKFDASGPDQPTDDISDLGTLDAPGAPPPPDAFLKAVARRRYHRRGWQWSGGVLACLLASLVYLSTRPDSRTAPKEVVQNPPVPPAPRANGPASGVATDISAARLRLTLDLSLLDAEPSAAARAIPTIRLTARSDPDQIRGWMGR